MKNENVIDLLKKMVEGNVLHWKSFWGAIQRISNKEEFGKDPNRIIKSLMNANMFCLGVEIQCPVCTQRSWYSIKDFDYKLQCLKCSESFNIPSNPSKDIKWSYRAHGPFSLPRGAYGVYSVLLTLKYFSQPHANSITPIMSFVLKKEQKQLEVDLGLFLKEANFGRNKTYLVLAECKTYNHFKKEDIGRMKSLGKQFPGAILVFSTLRMSLTEKEKRILRPFVNQGRRSWKAEHPFNPILILTGIELFSRKEPPYCWEKMDGKHKAFVNANYLIGDIIALCDVTQQLYLDMKSRFEWYEERWARRRQMAVEKHPK